MRTAGLATLLLLLHLLPLRADAARPCRASWGVRVSRAPGGAIAVWSGEEVRVSRDDGRTFSSLPGGRGHVDAVAVGRAGTVFVVRAPAGTEGPRVLEVHARGRAARSAPMPTRAVYGLGAGGGWLVALGPGEVVATRDHGRSWWRSPYTPDFTQDLSVDGDGHLDLLVADVNTCGSTDRLQRLKHLRGRAGEALPDAPYAFADGPPYGLWTPTGRGRVFAQSAEGIVRVRNGVATLVWKAPPSREPPSRYWPPFSVAGNGHTTVASHGRHLVRLTPGRPTVLASDLPAGFAVEAVDARGRVLGVASGRVLRWSPAGGFVELAGPCR